MKMKSNIIKAVIFGFFLLTAFSACKTLKQPDEIQTPLNYTDEDVINSEIERINEFAKTEPVKALWRACLLGRKDIIQKNYTKVRNQLLNQLDAKDYNEAFRYYSTLINVNNYFGGEYLSETEINEFQEQLNSLFVEKALVLEGFEEKRPQSIADCINATVTVWVDKGIKVENGAGMADIVIGSGFFIDKRGYLITNHHVIEDLVDGRYEGFSRLYVKMLPDTDTKIPAKVIGYDSILDLALLKAEVEPNYVLSLGSSSDLQIGDKISAIGTPIGLEGTITSGIISATERKLLTLGHVFQIDAAVNSGNSGGPLIDEKMNVQAIVFAGMLQYQGLNFAIPVEYLKQELQYLYAGGNVQHAWIAAYGRTVRKGPLNLGLEVQYVIPGGSACMSRLSEDDVIYEAAGIKINTIDDFQFVLLSYTPGTIIPVKYKNEEKAENECLVYLEKRSEEPNALAYQSDLFTGSFIPMFGMKLKQSSTINRNSYIIEKVIRGGIADDANFSENDEITIKDIKLDEKNKYVGVFLNTKRRASGYLDMPITLANALDSPFYF